MLVRADHRGLASMTTTLAGCLKPERVLLVDMGTKHSPTKCHHEDWPDRWGTVLYDELLTGEYDWNPFLDGLNWVYSAEVPYDFRLLSEARRRGVNSLVHVMPELDPWIRQPELPRPDVIAVPTTWLADRYKDAALLPVPAVPFKAKPGGLVVHPSSLAIRDRNGTRPVLNASRRVRWPVVVRAQVAPDQPWFNARVEVEDRDDPRGLFDGAACVVIPRRYGGLSLVIQEAMSAGVPVLIPESDPYASVVPPEARVRAVEGRNLVAKGGTIRTWDCAPRDVAAAIDRVMSDDGLRAELGKVSRRWARANTWEKVRAAWDAVLT